MHKSCLPQYQIKRVSLKIRPLSRTESTLSFPVCYRRRLVMVKEEQKMKVFLGYMFDEKELKEVLRDEWLKIYDKAVSNVICVQAIPVCVSADPLLRLGAVSGRRQLESWSAQEVALHEHQQAGH